MLSGCCLLKGKIVFVVLTEVQSLRLGGDPLAGIVFEFTTLFGLHNYAPLDAQELILAHGGSVGAVGAGMGNLLSEQHCSRPLVA